jgi:hypothetical protein
VNGPSHNGRPTIYAEPSTPEPGPPDLPWAPDPGPPDAPVAQALNALSEAVYVGGASLTGWLGGSFDYPPNPCVVG